MGYAARRNPISRHGNPDPEALAMARIVRGCQFIRTPTQLEMLLDRICERQPDTDREATRDFLWEFCAFDAEAIRVEEAQVAQAAKIKAILDTPQQRDMYHELVRRLPADMQRAFAILNGHRHA